VFFGGAGAKKWPTVQEVEKASGHRLKKFIPLIAVEESD